MLGGSNAMTKALRFHAVVRGKALALPDLSAFEGKRVEVIVLAEDEGADATAETAVVPTAGPANGDEASAKAPALRRRFGSLQGKLVVHDDFDDPLPEDIQKYFEGRGDEVEE